MNQKRLVTSLNVFNLESDAMLFSMSAVGETDSAVREKEFSLDVDLWYVFSSLHGSSSLSVDPDEASYTAAPSPPFDSISSIRYSPTNPHQLLVSAWDAVRPVCSI